MPPQSVPVGALAARFLDAVEDEAASVVLIVRSEQKARRLAAFLAAVSPDDVLVLPSLDSLPYDRVGPSREATAERLRVLASLSRPSEKRRIVVAGPEAVLPLVPPEADQRTLEVTVGAALEADALRGFCEAAGYAVDDRVDEVGEVAFRGQVVDVFPGGAPEPVRIEIAEGRVAAIRAFDPLSQLTRDALDAVTLGPVSDEGRPREALVPLFHWLPDAAIVLEPGAAGRSRSHLAVVAETYREARSLAGEAAAGRVPPPERLYLAAREWDALLSERAITLAAEGIETAPRFASSSRPRRALSDHLARHLAAGRRVVVAGAQKALAAALGRAERVIGRTAEPAASWSEVLAAPPGAFLALEAEIDEGFADEALGVALIAAADILGSRASSADDGNARADRLRLGTAAFHVGDLVVHEDHGVGVLRGLERIDTPEGSREAIRLGYADDATLLVSVDEVDRLWLYGSEEGSVTLDRLKGDAWSKRRAKIEATLRKSARTMLALAQAREQAEAPRLVPPTAAYERFVERFAFSETPDQARAIEAVLQDLAAGRPMDRLVVGDVGFGKTEVALRAAAAVALSGKQVAIAAPTTVLARQHAETVARRFEGLGITVGHLSRLVARKEAAAVKAGLADGSVRIVVGTHALVGKGVSFADLGLVVIDEEQRFGTAHKAKLRKLAAGLHVLTMTATPIPRTMQSALVGVQDVSLIATPPARRRPIRTLSMPFDRAAVGAALRRERRRGGQSFVVVPRIEDLDRIAADIRASAPDLSLRIAHGKLPAAEVDDVMIAFSDRRGDVLLSTSIIESGLDVPAANTMIVVGAELFGLAQLHQLRGRVGRSAQQAYCWLMTEPGRDLPDATAKRLATLTAFDRLGAGMAIAARDLDLRGAGDLVGEEQAGHAELVGLGLYQDLFATALRRARGDTRPRFETDLQIDMAAALPADYVPEPELRIDLYHRLARAGDIADIERLGDEIADRFGPPPRDVEALLEIARLRAAAHALGVTRIAAGPQGLAVPFVPGEEPGDDALAELSHVGAPEWTGERLVVRRASKTPQERLALAGELLEALEG